MFGCCFGIVFFIIGYGDWASCRQMASIGSNGRLPNHMHRDIMRSGIKGNISHGSLRNGRSHDPSFLVKMFLFLIIKRCGCLLGLCRAGIVLTLV